ncbi:MAG: hypothetical protein HQL27_01825 [Candidatus Omnitrophica bacterium]|nr:hypothetical protein [Candidatus Omnitrophota bacterium]
MHLKDDKDIVFLHLTDLPSCGCVFCSTRDKKTGKTKLYLVFENKDTIYVRDGVWDVWQELLDPDEYLRIKMSFAQVIEARNVPCFCG